MAYEHGKVYWICPADKTSLALSVYGNSVVSQNRNVFLYNRQDVADQKWYVDIGKGFLRLKSMLNQSYALNIYTGSSNYNNCDIHTWADNLEDSKINFRTIDSYNNLYRIQNYHNDQNNDLYLTAVMTTAGSDVRWASLDSSTAHQKWKLIEVTSEGSTGGDTNSINIPVRLCQKNHPKKGFQNAGCAVTAGIMAAAYHDNIAYGITSFDVNVNGQAIWTEYTPENKPPYCIYSWLTPKGWKFQDDRTPSSIPSDADTVAYIKRYIDAGIPPLCYCPGKEGHWMLAYKYTSGSTFSAIRTIDPADGTEKSLADGMNLSCGGTGSGITRIEAKQLLK